MKTGEPPTERKARTGEFTPPAMIPRARANAEIDRSRRKIYTFKRSQSDAVLTLSNTRSFESRTRFD
jgi:hypothetical protein